MHDFPEKTCSIERLIRHPKLIAAAKSGVKTQQRRDGVYAWPGEEFELDGVTFTVTDLRRERLGDMSDEQARAEGYPDLASYQALILQMHPGMMWETESLAWVHCFAIKTG
ncbi:MAG: hypothetical protein CVV13_03315 [Gammaproteobacteria bacterium HGW-Gammaproteobacteria-3]|nr:MAG: hypothetical protein CVV13_03315 [Gammaproteobacteria bacterium HGW-Gammaproteobacteria-3]